VDGILLLDKPLGATSNGALQRARRLFRAAKAGHTGSLDPRATGLLPLLFGEATKISDHLLLADKAYEAELCLGVRTTTGDGEGEVVAVRPVDGVDEARIEALLPRFTGAILQVPPMHSALKRDGQPLYRLARQGLEVERAPRPVTIHTLRCDGLAGDRLRLALTCSKGTYVRTLAEDLGEALGCGAHLAALRRSAVGPFTLAESWTFEALEGRLADGGEAALDTCLLPMDRVLAHLTAVQLTDDAAFYFRRGQPIFVAGAAASVGSQIRVYGETEGFLGIGAVLADGRIGPRRLIREAREPDEPHVPG
jgi:tRNA pseudouridine55 synthase